MKQKKDNRDLVTRFTKPLIEPIRKAADIGAWEGIDGASQYLNSDRIKMLRSFSEDAYRLGLEVCLRTIVDSTKAKHNETVLQHFTKNNMDFVLKISKLQPEIFQNDEIKRLCANVMDDKVKKQFDKNTSNIKEENQTQTSPKKLAKAR